MIPVSADVCFENVYDEFKCFYYLSIYFCISWNQHSVMFHPDQLYFEKRTKKTNDLLLRIIVICHVFIYILSRIIFYLSIDNATYNKYSSKYEKVIEISFWN